MIKLKPYEMYDRIQTRDDWTLYVHDYYWVLVIDGYYEFYYNPMMYLGKIKAEQMPPAAISRMGFSCRVFTPWDRTGKDEINGREERNFHPGFMHIKSGNVFCVLGNWIVTAGKQVWHAPYDEVTKVCGIKEMSWFTADCMMRMMNVETRTPKYFPDIHTFRCFSGVEIRHLIERDK